MMTQEQYVRVQDLHKQGWTITEIAAETGFHPATISKYLKHGPPQKRTVPDDARVMNAHWRDRITTTLRTYPLLLAVSLFHLLKAEGFAGSYPTVVRAVRDVRGPRFRAADAASVPLHTDPGEEAQFDFCELDDWAARWGWSTPLVCFGAILCWSRWRLWWFTTSQDRHHTFEGLVRFFEAVGGIPTAGRTDRMGALGTSQGARFVLHPPTLGFAAHHGCKITSCKARDAKRKGKVERPFRQLQETFLPEMEVGGPPATIDELNQRAAAWLAERVHAVPSRATGIAPEARLQVERPFLAPLPRTRFDTDYVATRRVHPVFPFIALDGVRYSVPPDVLGQAVQVRRPVDADSFEVRWAGRVVASHRLAAAGTTEVWDPEHRAAAERSALQSHRPVRHLHVVADPDPRPAGEGRLDLGDGDYDVEIPDLVERYGLDHIDVDDGEEAGA